ncbi:MAG: hypothetical protein JSS11_17740 [Verrucomicrobia bacterium]|nr:hypothetical protein [Verrucomicrobiota bacterium]
MRLKFLLGLAAALCAAGAPRLAADPFSKKQEIDFFRDVPSRNLSGLAARSDGRLVAGPTLTELTGSAPADLLWCLAPGAKAGQWLVGTGPDGRVFELTVDRAKGSYTAKEVAQLGESHVFALLRLPNGDILAGTSPRGALCLIRGGKLAARLTLPVDSIFDLLLRKDGSVLAATGNPGRVYRITLPALAAAGDLPDKIMDAKTLAQHGVTLFGEIRDRNVRRLAQLPDGRVIAGSAPRGNVYAFAAAGGDPVILQENREAEVTDLLTEPDGDFYAAITFSGNNAEARITPSTGKGPKAAAAATATADGAQLPAAPEKFSGRAALVRFPANGFPETLSSRSGTAFYGLAQQGDVLLISGGELGELGGYDVAQRLSLTYAGSNSAQLNALRAVPGEPGRFVALRNNAPGLALLDFTATGPRSAETRRLDLTVPGLLGALRIDRLRDLQAKDVAVEIRTSNGSDEVEGWSPWTTARFNSDAWKAENLRGRYVRLRLKVPAGSSAALQIDKPDLYLLPQNRRPQLQEYRVLPSNYAVIPAAESPAPVVTSLSSLLASGAKDDDGKRKPGFLSSQVMPSPGAQVVLWTVSDPDGDNVACTFSIRRDGDEKWTDLAVATHDPYVQFDTSHLPDGLYFTRLVATEEAPRPAAERLSTTFETDDLVVDHTPPELLDATAKRTGDKLIVSVHGRDALSLLAGIEVALNNGLRTDLEQPADGIRDSREETFVLEIPLSDVSGATSLEVTLYDDAGNSVAKRLSW